MSKDSKSKAKDGKTVVQAEVVRVHDNPLAVAQPVTGPQVQLDMRIGIDDLVNIAVSDKSEQLAMDREAAELRLSDAVKAHARLVAQLESQAKALIEERGTDEEARDLAALLTKFTGDKHVVRLVKVGASVYAHSYAYRSSQQEKEDIEPVIDIARLMIEAEIRVGTGVNCEHVVVTRETKISFSDLMKATVGQIEWASQTVAELTEKLNMVRRQVADLPRMASRARAELTKGYLRGQLTDTKKILDTVMQTPIKALPITQYDEHA